jgi:hypothetical protein
METAWRDAWTRRRVGVVGGLASALLGLSGREVAEGRKKRKHKKHKKQPCDKYPEGQSCSFDDQCCSESCVSNQCAADS